MYIVCLRVPTEKPPAAGCGLLVLVLVLVLVLLLLLLLVLLCRRMLWPICPR